MIKTAKKNGRCLRGIELNKKRPNSVRGAAQREKDHRGSPANCRMKAKGRGKAWKREVLSELAKDFNLRKGREGRKNCSR